MRPSKVKPLRRLYFQWGRLLSPRLDALEVFSALERAGLIEGAAFRSGEPTHYRETEQLRSLPEGEFETAVLRTLRTLKGEP